MIVFRFREDMWCHFTIHDLAHLLNEIIGIDEVNEKWLLARKFQYKHNAIKCWDCEEIAKKLEDIQNND